MRIAQVSVVGDTHGRAFRQDIRCGSHALVADEPIQLGGADAGPSQFGYLLAGLGACTSITLRMYAEKKKWDLGTVTVNLELVEDQGASRIKRTVSVSGAVSEEQCKRLAEICERTPVTLVVKNGVPVNTTLGATAAK